MYAGNSSYLSITSIGFLTLYKFYIFYSADYSFVIKSSSY